MLPEQQSNSIHHILLWLRHCIVFFVCVCLYVEDGENAHGLAC